MTPNYPLNCWYVAAGSDELDGDSGAALEGGDLVVDLVRLAEVGYVSRDLGHCSLILGINVHPDLVRTRAYAHVSEYSHGDRTIWVDCHSGLSTVGLLRGVGLLRRIRLLRGVGLLRRVAGWLDGLLRGIGLLRRIAWCSRHGATASARVEARYSLSNTLGHLLGSYLQVRH